MPLTFIAGSNNEEVEKDNRKETIQAAMKTSFRWRKVLPRGQLKAGL
jgi:hypothetical protein